MEIERHTRRCTICNHKDRKLIEYDALNEVPKNASIEEVAAKYGVGYKSLLKHLEVIGHNPPPVDKPFVSEPLKEVEKITDPEKALEFMMQSGLDSKKMTGNAAITAATQLAKIRREKNVVQEEEETVLNALDELGKLDEGRLDEFIGRVESAIKTLEGLQGTSPK